MSDLEKNVSVPASRPSLTIAPVGPLTLDGGEHISTGTNNGTRTTGRSHSVSSGGGLSAVEKDSIKKPGLTNVDSDCVAVLSVPALVSSHDDQREGDITEDDDSDEDYEGELKRRRMREAETAHRPPGKVGRIMLPTFAALTLAWWVSGLVVTETKHQWYVCVSSSLHNS